MLFRILLFSCAAVSNLNSEYVFSAHTDENKYQIINKNNKVNETAYHIWLRSMTADRQANFTNLTWPADVNMDIDGDVMLGALMMVHERADEPQICGDVFTQGGVQAVEMLIYTLKEINRQRFIPHTTLGAVILDDCDKDTYGLQQAVLFIKDHVMTLHDTLKCKTEAKMKEEEGNPNYASRNKPIVGVVGASSSVTSIQVANLLNLFHIPQISYFSTSAELNDTKRFPYFFRTIPSDEYQVRAMVDIVLEFGWSYISIIYEDSSYGKTAFDSLERLLSENNVCIAVRQKLPKDSSVAGPEQSKQIVEALRAKKDATGVIIYGSDQEVKSFMTAVTVLGAVGEFTWIGSDGWSERKMVYDKGNEEAVLGTISVQPLARRIHGFENHYYNLQPSLSNFWFTEMWERTFACRYPGSRPTPFNQVYQRPCTVAEQDISKHSVVDKQLQFVSDAVMAFAVALKRYLLAKCPSSDYSCIKGQYPLTSDDSKRINGTELRDFIDKVEFNSLTDVKNTFRFFGNGAPPQYRILQFHNGTGYANPSWVNVGVYTYDGLNITHSLLKFYTRKSEMGKIPKSVCAEPCPQGHRTIGLEQGDRCCWECIPCTERSYLFNRTHCQTCDPGSVPNDNRTGCNNVTLRQVHFDNVYCIACHALAAVGLLFTLFSLLVFLLYNDTPIVKASGRELSFVIIAGLFLCYAMTPLMWQTPTTAVCSLQRTLSGFCFTLIYAALLTKTNRIARIFGSGHHRHTTLRPKYISPNSQLIICFAIAAVQFLIVGVWQTANIPEAIIRHPQPDKRHLICREAVEYTYLVGYAYPIMLCVICTIYAIQTRKIPEAFNESKYIGAAVYTTCVIWIAFVPIYFAVKDRIILRVTSVCISTTLTAFVCQFCLFFPKLNIILLHPERNVRQGILGVHKTSSSAANKLNSYLCDDPSLLEPLHNDNVHIAATQTSPCSLDRRSVHNKGSVRSTTGANLTSPCSIDRKSVQNKGSVRSTTGAMLARLNQARETLMHIDADDNISQ